MPLNPCRAAPRHYDKMILQLPFQLSIRFGWLAPEGVAG